MALYNPIELGNTVEKHVSIAVDGVVHRKYYRFRATRFYGGSATADTVGCNLRCVYCWSYRYNTRYREVGEFYSPQNVVEKLLSMAVEYGYRYLRISGGEPTLAFNHLIQVLNTFSKRDRDGVRRFIIETNGILLGYRPELLDILSEYRRYIMVRVSLKGCSEEEFQSITSAEGRFFKYQLESIKYAIDRGLDTYVAIPASFCSKESVANLIERLADIDADIVRKIDVEVVVLYRANTMRLCRKGLKPWIAVEHGEKRALKGMDLNEYFERICREADRGDP